MVVENIKRVRDIVNPSRLPDYDFVINPYVGCTHKCMYCYAEFMKRFSKHEEDWGEFVDAKLSSRPINLDRKSTRLNSSHDRQSRMPSSA